MDVRKIIIEIGGQAKAAEFFEISQPAISQWISANKIPPARLLHLKAARPDLFEQQQDKAAA